MNYYLILNTENNKKQGFKFGYTNEKPPETVEFTEKRTVNGTEYSAETPDEVVNIIEKCRNSNRSYRLKFDFGDTRTGQSWGEVYDVAGYIGRSTGTRKIPLLINNRRSHGGGGLMDNRIVKISMAKGGQVLWVHPNYQPPKQ